MQLTKRRWSKVYESSEEELLEFLRSRGLTARRVELAEFETADEQTAPGDIALWCAEGSMTIRTQSGPVSQQPGDSVQLPAGTEFTLVGGISGCVYYTSAD